MRLALDLAISRSGGGAGALLRASPTSVPGGATATRATTATYKDVGGTRQTAGINVLRSGHFIGGVQTILLEGASTNHFLNSGTPATQTSASLATGTYTLWMEGTGSIAVAGTTATITGAGTAVAGTPVTFVVTVAGTVTYTVTGAPTLAQAENLAFPSSYIPTTGAAVTRAADGLSLPFPVIPQAMTVYAKYNDLGLGGFQNGRVFQIGKADNSNPRLLVQSPLGTYTLSTFHANAVAGTGTSGATVATALNDVVEARTILNADGSTQVGRSQNGGAESLSTASASVAPLAPTWSDVLLWVGGLNAGVTTGFAAFQSIKVATGLRSVAEMRVL